MQAYGTLQANLSSIANSQAGWMQFHHQLRVLGHKAKANKSNSYQCLELE
jgi:hypothetical protein